MKISYTFAFCLQIVPLVANNLEPHQIYKLGVIPFFDPITYSSKYNKVSVYADGKVLGWIRTAYVDKFIKKLKHLRSIGSVSF